MIFLSSPVQSSLVEFSQVQLRPAQSSRVHTQNPVQNRIVLRRGFSAKEQHQEIEFPHIVRRSSIQNRIKESCFRTSPEEY